MPETTNQMSIYVHPQETWDEAKCDKAARYAPKDHWGNRPPKGIISRSGSAHVQYGETLRFNGGCVRDGEWYEGERKPLPIIPDTYEIVTLSSWGLRIQRKKP